MAINWVAETAMRAATGPRGSRETNQTLQRIEQMMSASQARKQARDDRKHARNIRLQAMERDISRLLGDMLTLHREHDLMGRRLDRCT
ncbi:Hypothetical predicted protein [Olea europaea subsp. europaea]|uniref:Uncharacterized protein n=1 Tax=Olea europaea subsp. europaea TaxID=158383 RepID=A0A8S0QWV6_OLEEU|nr:Hypothetical predicted protein [Olea europaea subsp. europaea]